MSGILYYDAGWWKCRDNAGAVGMNTTFKPNRRDVGLGWQIAWGRANGWSCSNICIYVNNIMWWGFGPTPVCGIGPETLGNLGFVANTEYTTYVSIILEGITYTSPTISFKTAPTITTLNYPATKPSLINSNAEIWDAKCQNWVPINETSYSSRILQAIGGGRYKETLICVNDKGNIYYGDI